MKPNLNRIDRPYFMPSSSHSTRIQLCQLPAGATGRVCELTGDESFCQRVREMGFGEAALVTKVSGTKTSLCLVNGTRLAINHRAAMSIMVEPLPGKVRQLPAT
jgi:ferrous iron transport protein A